MHSPTWSSADFLPPPTQELTTLSPTHENIRRVALELFVTKGYNATGLREIADAVNIKASSLYNHISTKEDLLFELMDSAMDLASGSVGDLFTDMETPVERLIIFADAHFRYHANYGSLVFLSNSELRSLTGERLEHIKNRRRNYERTAREIFEALTEGNDAAMDPQLHTISLMSKGTHLASWYRPERELSLDTIVESFITMTLRELKIDISPERIRAVLASAAHATATPEAVPAASD